MRSRLALLGLIMLGASMLGCGEGTYSPMATGLVYGTLVSPDTGLPVVRIWIDLGHEEDVSGVAQVSRDSQIAPVITDTGGGFSFPAVPAGTYILMGPSGAPLVPKAAVEAAVASPAPSGVAVYYVATSTGPVAVPWSSIGFEVKAKSSTNVGVVYCTDPTACPVP